MFRVFGVLLFYFTLTLLHPREEKTQEKGILIKRNKKISTKIKIKRDL